MFFRPARSCELRFGGHTVSPPLPGFPAAGIEDEATDSILLLGLRGTHFGDGKGILWSNNVLWTRVGAPSCGPGCVLT